MRTPHVLSSEDVGAIVLAKLASLLSAWFLGEYFFSGSRLHMNRKSAIMTPLSSFEFLDSTVSRDNLCDEHSSRSLGRTISPTQ